MIPETGAQRQDGVWVSSNTAGHARLSEPQDAERAARPSDPPDVKFKRVWSSEFRGGSGTEHITQR